MIGLVGPTQLEEEVLCCLLYVVDVSALQDIQKKEKNTNAIFLASGFLGL